MKIATSQFGLAGAIFALSATALPAAEIPIETQINTTTVIRSDISRATFGSSVESRNPQFGWVMGKAGDQPASDNTRLKIKDMKLGLMRFPGGDPAQGYIWDNPQKGYPESNPANPHAQWNTQDEMLTWTSASGTGLNMQRLFQVNTCCYLQYTPSWALVYVNGNFFQPSTPYINPDALDKTAKLAAAWVKNNVTTKPADQKVDYWELGNEDWIYWTGAQYGQICNSFITKMKAEKSDIKILIQSLSANFTTPHNGVNTMDSWFNGLRDNIAAPTSVWGVSDHQYLSGDVVYDPYTLDESRRKETENMLAKVDAGTRTAALRTKLNASTQTAPWKIWVTEFNATAKNAAGNSVELQDMGHALVIADWTGKMLEQNVERMCMFSLDHEITYALIQYVNSGTTIALPRVNVPAYAYAMYAQEFGQKMVSNNASIAASNPTLTADNGSSYKQLSVYSSIQPGTGGPSTDTMRVIIINRSQTNTVNLSLKTANGTGARRMQNAPYTYRQLRSAHVYDSNKTVLDNVKWTAPLTYMGSEWGINGAILGPASVNLFIIPLQ